MSDGHPADEPTANGADVSVTIEQQIPLSGIRGHRRASALADIDRLRAQTDRAALDVGVEAAIAYLMLQERRQTAALVNEQIAFARDVVHAANARYASGTAPQSDVLRATFAMFAAAILSIVLAPALMVMFLKGTVPDRGEQSGEQSAGGTLSARCQAGRPLSRRSRRARPGADDHRGVVVDNLRAAAGLPAPGDGVGVL